MGNKSLSRGQKKMEKEAFKADKKEAKAERAALKITNNTALGVHNCPVKDAGTTHAFRARCIRQKHGGYCPACGNIFGYMYGCREHSCRGDSLLERSPNEQEKKDYRIQNGLEAEAEVKEESAEGEAVKGKEKGKK